MLKKAELRFGQYNLLEQTNKKKDMDESETKIIVCLWQCVCVFVCAKISANSEHIRVPGKITAIKRHDESTKSMHEHFALSGIAACMYQTKRQYLHGAKVLARDKIESNAVCIYVCVLARITWTMPIFWPNWHGNQGSDLGDHGSFFLGGGFLFQQARVLHQRRSWVLFGVIWVLF